MLTSLRRSAYAVLFIVATVFALGWLLLGALPALAAASGTFHSLLHDVATYGGPFSELARNAGQASHSVSDQGQVPLDYLFSIFNLGLALVVIWLRPNDPAARLLTIGLIGSSVAFNLQGHDALQVFPAGWLGPVNAVHVWIHIASGLCYVFALLLFPSGGFVPAGRLYTLLRPLVIGLVAFFFLAVSSITVDDHTTGLVILFGIFIPIAGITSQVGRYRKAQTEEEREQSRVLVWALGLAIVVAAPLMYVTDSLEGGGKSETVEYEIEIPLAGRYFFRCDPHPDEMRGVLIADASGPVQVALDARDNRFDVATITLRSDAPTAVTFTNFDGDLHNVAIYRDSAMTRPVFIGKEFSGSTAGLAAFRVFRVVLLVIPLALLVGLVKFRLWDVNRLLRRTLAYGLVVGFITGAYLTIVVGLGSLLGIGRFTPALSIVVMVLVAALFQPLRDGAKRLANRLVYGKRATPYDLLSEFSARVGTTPDLERLVPDLARTLGTGTGAIESEVWLRVGNDLICAAAWPEGRPMPNVEALRNGSPPHLAGRDRVVAVSHAGELLGVLTITKGVGDEVTPLEDRLLKDAASQTGIALRNVQLTAELHARLDELRASRQRIVAAQDAERRRLERDIHDGAQQHLVALSMKLRTAEDLAVSDPKRAREMLAELQNDTGDALQALRNLARGIHPPVLSDRGLVAALDAHARRASLPISVRAAKLTRHDANIETAVYFCCTEAIQNAIKHSEAAAVLVELTQSPEALTFVVSDDGVGFDPTVAGDNGLANMHDRVAALAGELVIDSQPGRGTRITGHIPLG